MRAESAAITRFDQCLAALTVTQNSVKKRNQWRRINSNGLPLPRIHKQQSREREKNQSGAHV